MSRLSFAFIFAFLLLQTPSTLAKEATKNKPEEPKQKTTIDKSKKGAKVNPTITIETSMGTMEAELFQDKSPESVNNFLKYVEEKFYDDTIFHRVIEGFMVQGGGFTPGMKQKNTHAPIKNEATNGLKNDRGTLAMARTNDINSATSQFFINHADNNFLNHSGNSPHTYGYAVFGKLTKGLDILDKIAKAPTGNSGLHQNVPKEPITIKSIRKK